MLHRLSNTLGELYRISDELPVSDCVDALFLAARKLVPFDSAAMGDASGPQPQGLVPSAAHSFGLDLAAFAALARLAGRDPFAQAFHAGGMPTLSIDCTRSGPDRAAPLRELAQAHGIGHLLLTGTPAAEARPACWIVLARGNGAPFREPDLTYLEVTWPHLARCLYLVRRRALAGLAQAHGPGVALLYPDGAVMAADPPFESLCRTEWQCGTNAAMPSHVLSTLQQSGDYMGRTLRLRLWRQDGWSVCRATARTPCELLTRAERVVALRYASGESYKEIAVSLSVSDNTVRTHLAHVYDKLGIHRKTDLIRQIGNLH